MALTVSVDEVVRTNTNPLLKGRPHWSRARLGEVGSVLNGFAFKSSLFTRESGTPLIRIRDVGRDASETYYTGEFDSRYIVEPGDLLIGMDGDFNCARWSGPKSLLNQRVCKVMVHPSVCHPRWLDYVLPGYLRAINEATSSITVKHLSSRTVEDIPLPLPPMSEQIAIVAEFEKQFSRLDEAVANLQRVKANLRRYRASVLKAALAGCLVRSEGAWTKAKLGEVAISIRNGFSRKPDAERGTRIFRISAVRPMKLDTEDVRYLSGELAAYEPYICLPGDVLFTRYNGSRDYVGVCAQVPDCVPPTVYPDKLIRVRVSKALLPSYLVAAASTGVAREFIESRIRTTAGQSGISGSDVKAIPIALPSINEQARIVGEIDRRLSVVAGLESEVDANLKRAQALRQATLAKAFAP